MLELTQEQKTELESLAEDIGAEALSLVANRYQDAWRKIATDTHGTDGDKRNFRRLVIASVGVWIGKMS